MSLQSFLFPILAQAHGGGDIMSLGELLLSVGLLVLSSAIAAAMLILVFMKPIMRVRRQWKEGRLPHSSRTMYVILIVAVVCAFIAGAWSFGSAAYYDIQQKHYDERLAESGKSAKKRGAEYKWNRWRIAGRYQPNQLILFVDDIFENADPQQKITATARLISPSTTAWQPMIWNAQLKAFTSKFDPQGEKMEFEFHMKSGWSSYTDEVIGYVPRLPTPGQVTDPGHPTH